MRSQEDTVNALVQMVHGHPTTPLKYILEILAPRHQVSMSTLRRWYIHYLAWGEYLFETRAKARRYRKRKNAMKRTNLITEEVVLNLKEIVEANP